jgi:hypothetical protein
MPKIAKSFLERFKTTTFEVLWKSRMMGHNIGLAEISLLSATGWGARSVCLYGWKTR